MSKCPHHTVVLDETKCYRGCPLYIRGKRCAREYGESSDIPLEYLLREIIGGRVGYELEWWIEAANYARPEEEIHD